MESLQPILGKGLAIAARLGYRVFRTAIFNALFLMDEDDLEMAIEKDVDLLGMFLIYTPQQLKITRQFVGRIAKGYNLKNITLSNSLRWAKEESDRKKTRHYDVIVNVPKVEPVEGVDAVEKVDIVDKGDPVYPPPGADMKRVNWFWGNVQRLLEYFINGRVSNLTKRWGVEHLKWRVQQEAAGKRDMADLLKEVRKNAQQKEEKENV